MDKRAFLEGFFAAGAVAFGGQLMWRRMSSVRPKLVGVHEFGQLPLPEEVAAEVEAPLPGYELSKVELDSVMPAEGLPAPAPTLPAESVRSGPDVLVSTLSDAQVDDYLQKIRNFDAIFASDLYLDPSYEDLLLRTTRHLARVEAYMGHGNFNLLSFDNMLRASRNFSAIGEFDRRELAFLEEVFFANPNRYGFFGRKIHSNITDTIPSSDVVKIANTGHYLFKGESQRLYDQIRRDVGDNVILTSGVRGIVKQIHLFLAKAVEADGNLSRASRSLAPPGHSYHGIGDFDVGKIGMGARNFTEEFSGTEEFRRLSGLDYVDIRYPTDNLFGVRFEPWHIKLS